jgi:hypothetical protein
MITILVIYIFIFLVLGRRKREQRFYKKYQNHFNRK